MACIFFAHSLLLLLQIVDDGSSLTEIGKLIRYLVILFPAAVAIPVLQKRKQSFSMDNLMFSI